MRITVREQMGGRMEPTQDQTTMDKKAWRIMMRTLFASVSPQERRAFSEAICGVLSGPLPGEPAGRMLAAFQPRIDEPDIRPFTSAWLAAGGRLCLPVCLSDADGSPRLEFREIRDPESELRPSAFGLHEPVEGTPVVPCDAVRIILVPGSAFDRTGGRLGRGKGYYDRFLAACPHADTIAPVFPWQIVDHVPMEAHDVRIGWLATADGMIRCG